MHDRLRLLAADLYALTTMTMLPRTLLANIVVTQEWTQFLAIDRVFLGPDNVRCCLSISSPTYNYDIFFGKLINITATSPAEHYLCLGCQATSFISKARKCKPSTNPHRQQQCYLSRWASPVRSSMPWRIVRHDMTTPTSHGYIGSLCYHLLLDMTIHNHLSPMVVGRLQVRLETR
jgi:hypothetical protein